MKTVRLWRLGYINPLSACDSVLPTRESLEKLRNLIATEEGKGGNVLDIIWGPDLDLSIYTYPDDSEVIDIVQSAEEAQ